MAERSRIQIQVGDIIEEQDVDWQDVITQVDPRLYSARMHIVDGKVKIDTDAMVTRPIRVVGHMALEDIARIMVETDSPIPDPGLEQLLLDSLRSQSTLGPKWYPSQ